MSKVTSHIVKYDVRDSNGVWVGLGSEVIDEPTTLEAHKEFDRLYNHPQRENNYETKEVTGFIRLYD